MSKKYLFRFFSPKTCGHFLNLIEPKVTNSNMQTPSQESPKRKATNEKFSSVRKSQRSTPADTPQCKKNDSFAYNLNEIAKVLESLSGQKPHIAEPSTLEDLETEKIEDFLSEFGEFVANGGQNSMFNFIEAGLLNLIRDMEMDKPQASEVEVKTSLRQETKPRTVQDIHSILCRDVCIDNSQMSGKAKLQSLFISLNAAIKKISLQEVPARSADFVFDFEQRKLLVLSKLPTALQAEFEVWEKYKPKSTNQKQLYLNVRSVVDNYNGNWGKPAKTKTKARVDIDLEEAYREELEEARNMSSRLTL